MNALLGWPQPQALTTVHLLVQMYFQAKYLIPDPIANDVKYQVRTNRQRTLLLSC